MLKLVVGLLWLAVSTAEPTRPNISETFTSEMLVEFHDVTGTHFGYGIWDVDVKSNRGVENYTLTENGRTERVEVLQLYDQKTIYVINSYGTNHCINRTVKNDTIPNVFGFLSNATYKGTEEYRHNEYQMWGVDAGGVEIEVGVASDNTTRPVIFRRRQAASETFMFFTAFDEAEPPASVFTIPAECTHKKNF